MPKKLLTFLTKVSLIIMSQKERQDKDAKNLNIINSSMVNNFFGGAKLCEPFWGGDISSSPFYSKFFAQNCREIISWIFMLWLMFCGIAMGAPIRIANMFN